MSVDIYLDKMDIQTSQSILGQPTGILYGQYDRTEDLNKRISERNIPNTPIQPHISFRSMETKHTKFPLMNDIKPRNEPLLEYPTFNSSQHFLPGTSRAPASGYISNVNVETILRNQTFGLQHGASQSVYVPSSNSELYNVRVPSKPSVQPHPNLFRQFSFDNKSHDNLVGGDIGIDRFHNHTRTQLRNQ
jgi:hypothetical protein